MDDYFDHLKNILEAERIRKLNKDFIWIYPKNVIDGTVYFVWEIELQNGSSRYSFKEVEQGYPTYEDALHFAIRWYKKEQLLINQK